MGLNRKEFLKFAGAATLFGLGGATSSIFAELEETPPITGKKTGKRLGMVVDMRKCIEKKNCTKCIEACHSNHNVPEWRTPDGKPDRKVEIKWIWKEPGKHLFPDRNYKYDSTVKPDADFMALCNHCDNPPCVRVCPTQATFKRPDGIVMMDFHRCIGCRFCMAGCPYGSRSFNFFDPRTNKKLMGNLNPNFPTRTRGVVEKCNFCAERLRVGKGPHCVEACEEKALTFGDLNDENSPIRQVLRENRTLRRKPELGTEPSVFYIV